MVRSGETRGGWRGGGVGEQLGEQAQPLRGGALAFEAARHGVQGAELGGRGVQDVAAPCCCRRGRTEAEARGRAAVVVLDVFSVTRRGRVTPVVLDQTDSNSVSPRLREHAWQARGNGIYLTWRMSREPWLHVLEMAPFSGNRCVKGQLNRPVWAVAAALPAMLAGWWLMRGSWREERVILAIGLRRGVECVQSGVVAVIFLLEDNPNVAICDKCSWS